MGEKGRKICILIPCLNEGSTIASVIEGFKKTIPSSQIYVFDNGSTDNTREEALRSGAKVRNVLKQGKGIVVQRMFQEIEADYYVLVDGDDTYPANKITNLLDPLFQGRCDMVVGKRRAINSDGAFRRFHELGNKLISWIINFFYKANIKDVFSGYRAFNRNYVKNIPLLAKGFEVETEMTLQALDKGYEILEIEVPYYERKNGSISKLNTYKDGVLVFKTILSIIKNYKPLYFFSVIGFLSIAVGLGFGSFIINEFLKTNHVYHPSTAVLSVAMIIIGLISFATGLILDSSKRHYSEQFKLISRITETLNRQAQFNSAKSNNSELSLKKIF